MTWKPYNGSKYLDYSEIIDWCQGAASSHPSWVELSVIGTSLEGRDILMLTIGDTEGERHNRPALWLDGGTHASEWTGVMAALHAASRWIALLAEGDTATIDRFRRATAYVVPCISPDGLQGLMDGLPFLRSTLRPQPAGTHRIGLDARDLTGNGRVGWMRWKHPSGSWVADPDQPMFMRLRTLDDDPADAWCFSNEGMFIHWDGTRWVDAPQEFALDLNRNFPVNWAPFRMFGMDSGAYPMSAPESRAVVDAVHAHPNVAVALTNHTYTGCILTQPYRDPCPLPKADIDLMERLAEMSVEGTGYRVIKVHPDFAYDLKKPVVGVWADALCCTFAIPAYTLELWNPYAFAGVELEKPVEFFQKPDEAIVRALVDKFAELPNGVMPWKPYDHPQLGAVEIGGIDYYRTIRNPPESELPAECARGYLVADRLLRSTPILRVEIDQEPVSDGAYRVTARIINEGFLSTSSLSHGVAIERVPPVLIQLAAEDGLEIVGGEATQVLGHLDGWGVKQVGFGRHALYPGLGTNSTRAHGQWIVRGHGRATITWTATRAGSGQTTVSLGDS
jgi:hypothetical protein